MDTTRHRLEVRTVKFDQLQRKDKTVRISVHLYSMPLSSPICSKNIRKFFTMLLRNFAESILSPLKAKNPLNKRSKCVSISTLEQTLVNISAVMSLSSLCCIAGKTSKAQPIIISKKYARSSFFSGQLYRKHNAFQNAAFFMQEPCSTNGNV